MIGFGESQNLIRDYFIFIVYVVGGIVYMFIVLLGAPRKW